ncbi:hypothetical protein [Serratia ureilytica]|uniref:Uncharacterized protein n=1 Tax=Serratia ureilytica TaxID=300181 RepID=A0A9X9C0L6_9GAMM|nr:hypothetical protein [Serratia ureilytica]TXE27094.1 hypothetical protein FOT63_19400 [Serratia ureilytica]
MDKESFQAGISAMQDLLIIASVIFTAIVLLGVRKSSSRYYVVISGILLIANSLCLFWLISSVNDTVIEAKTITLDKGFIKTFSLKTAAFLYIFPFISTAIGTNLISDAITKDLVYNDRTLLGDAFSLLKSIVRCVFFVLQLVFFVFTMALVYLIITPTKRIYRLLIGLVKRNDDI